ncbi:unnamed protein product, partial [Prorocentrum cordatum]
HLSRVRSYAVNAALSCGFAASLLATHTARGAARGGGELESSTCQSASTSSGGFGWIAPPPRPRVRAPTADGRGRPLQRRWTGPGPARRAPRAGGAGRLTFQTHHSTANTVRQRRLEPPQAAPRGAQTAGRSGGGADSAAGLNKQRSLSKRVGRGREASEGAGASGAAHERVRPSHITGDWGRGPASTEHGAAGFGVLRTAGRGASHRTQQETRGGGLEQWGKKRRGREEEKKR